MNPNHAAALNNLAAIAIRSNQKPRAIALLKQALALTPNDTASQHMLNALEGTNKNPTLSTEYAANLFNNYALQYDQHMQRHLKYQIPQHLAQVCLDLTITSVDNTLDLGCGTGLCGNILRPLTKKLIGVDIAAKMLDQARNKGDYDELIQSEILAFLQQYHQHYDLIISADTLPYFAELEALFTEINQHLTPKGYFIFSTEISTTLPWQLQPSARFSHHLDYLKKRCEDNGWRIDYCQEVVARLQEDKPLKVYLIAAQK